MRDTRNALQKQADNAFAIQLIVIASISILGLVFILKAAA